MVYPTRFAVRIQKLRCINEIACVCVYGNIYIHDFHIAAGNSGAHYVDFNMSTVL
jgi:hypothetical protein